MEYSSSPLPTSGSPAAGSAFSPAAPGAEQRLRVGAAAAHNPYSEQATAMPAVGDKIGPNVIQSLIGEGGSAAVFKVWHEELEVVRAIKILKQGFKTDSRERFFTEAKILADIRHPNIIEIHGLGYMEERVPYLELEFIDGPSIKSLLASNGRMPFSVALANAYFVCQALHYSHIKSYTLYGKIYKGLIHRDVKPENILISNDGIVKLMDFGIARPSQASLHTVGAKVMGTLVYLSPEQLNGQSLDHRSDIFSLGAVLYEMVTGHRAFPQKTLSELVQKKNAGQYRSFSSYGMEFPERLVSVIEKAMRLHPDERYSSAAEMGYDVYSVFSEMSDLAPYDAVAKYMRDPKSVPHWQPPSTTSTKHTAVGAAAKHDKKYSVLPWVIIAAAAGVIVSGLATMLLLK